MTDAIQLITINTFPFRWDRCTPRLGPAFSKLYIGTICLGSVSPELMGKGETQTFSYHCALPGTKREFMYGKGFADEAAAKARCEVVARGWFAIIDKARK